MTRRGVTITVTDADGNDIMVAPGVSLVRALSAMPPPPVRVRPWVRCRGCGVAATYYGVDDHNFIGRAFDARHAGCKTR